MALAASLDWITEGQQVEIVKNGEVIALFVAPLHLPG